MTDAFDIEIWTGLLRESLERLAADAVTQMSYLAGKDLAPLADELGLEFDTGWLPAKPVLAESRGAEALLSALAAVDVALDDDDLEWDFDGLRAPSRWKGVRHLAVRARTLLDAWHVEVAAGQPR